MILTDDDVFKVNKINVYRKEGDTWRRSFVKATTDAYNIDFSYSIHGAIGKIDIYVNKKWDPDFEFKSFLLRRTVFIAIQEHVTGEYHFTDYNSGCFIFRCKR